MRLEGAKIAVYNGSQDTGILDRTADYMRGLGAKIVQTAAASQSYTSTTIIDHTGNPYTLGFLVDLMHISAYKILIQFDPNSQVDVEVFLGSDWVRQNPLP